MTTYVLMVGSRDWDDEHTIQHVFELRTAGAEGEVRVLSGGARGADRLSVRMAKRLGLRTREFMANWSEGRGAGLARNERMVQFLIAQREAGHQVMCLAFCSKPYLEHSRGTADMVGRCRRHEIDTTVEFARVKESA